MTRSRELQTVSIAQGWLLELPLQQQSVLMLATRFADGARKGHPLKPVVRFYRACVMNAARYGRALLPGEGDTFMYRPRHERGQWLYYEGGTAGNLWDVVNKISDICDDLPHHYLMHLCHGAQILGERHPEDDVRQFWGKFYLAFVRSLHLWAEPRSDLDERLSDWGRRHWDE